MPGSYRQQVVLHILRCSQEDGPLGLWSSGPVEYLASKVYFTDLYFNHSFSLSTHIHGIYTRSWRNVSFYSLKENCRVPWWLSRLRIWCCPCCGSGYCWAVGWIPDGELLHATSLAKKKKKKIKNRENRRVPIVA